LQLETELAGHGWRTLWVERGREGSAVAAVRDSGEPAVLVVDYAETRPGLAELLAEAAAAGGCPDVRVVLLARSAATAYRALAQARPDAFLPDLATALNNQSERLADLGRREEALAAIEEAATTYRALAQARPAVFASRYASSLVGWKPRPRSCRSLAATAKRKRSSRKLPPSAEIAELHEQFTAHNATTRPADTSSKHTLVPQTRSRLVTASVATSLRLAFGLSNRREEGRASHGKLSTPVGFEDERPRTKFMGG
jgi:hypothetical protein